MANCVKIPNRLYPFQYQGVFCAKLPGEHLCWLNGVVQNPETGHVFVMDRENSKLKQFSSDGKLLNSLELVDYLHCMIMVSPSRKIVITKPDKRLLVVIETGNGQLKERKNFPTEKNYYGICQLDHVDDSPFVASSWDQLCIDIIDLDGHILNTITTDPTGRSLFGSLSSPDLVCVTSAGDIVVSSVGSVLLCIDQKGNQKWSKDIDGKIEGISSNRKGIIYFSFKDNHKGKSQMMRLEENIITSEQLFESPIAVFVTTSVLMITSESGDVHTYTIE